MYKTIIGMILTIAVAAVCVPSSQAGPLRMLAVKHCMNKKKQEQQQKQQQQQSNAGTNAQSKSGTAGSAAGTTK